MIYLFYSYLLFEYISIYFEKKLIISIKSHNTLLSSTRNLKSKILVALEIRRTSFKNRNNLKKLRKEDSEERNDECKKGGKRGKVLRISRSILREYKFVCAATSSSLNQRCWKLQKPVQGRWINFIRLRTGCAQLNLELAVVFGLFARDLI